MVNVSQDAVFAALIGVVAGLLLAFPIGFIKKRAELAAESSIAEHFQRFFDSRYAPGFFATVRVLQVLLLVFVAWLVFKEHKPDAVLVSEGKMTATQEAFVASFAFAMAYCEYAVLRERRWLIRFMRDAIARSRITKDEGSADAGDKSCRE